MSLLELSQNGNTNTILFIIVEETILFFFGNFKIIQSSVLLIIQDAFKRLWVTLPLNYLPLEVSYYPGHSVARKARLIRFLL